MNKDQNPQNNIVLMKGIGELTSSCNEKSEVEEERFQLSSFDQFGANPSINWNGDTYKTQLGSVFTLFYVVLTVYLIYISVDKFIGLDSPNVTFGTFNEIVPASDNINLMNSTFPYVTFYEYSHDEDYNPVVSVEDVLCNFNIIGLKKDFVGSLGFLAKDGVSEPIGTYCGNHLTSETKNGSTKTTQPNGFELKTKQEEIIRDGGICFETNNIHLFGEPVEDCHVKGDCQYYSILFEYKSASERASCSRSIDVENTVVSIQMFDNTVTPSNYSSPWDFESAIIKFYLLSDLGVDVNVFFTKLQLTTTAENFGVGPSSSSISTKLNLKKYENNKRKNLTDISLVINFMLGNKHIVVERDYMSFIDALSYFGGLKDFIIMIVALQYTNYLENKFEKDLIHKGIMITGKLGQNQSSVKYLEDVYDKKAFHEPEFSFFNKISSCRKKGKVMPEDKETKENDEITDEAFGNILSRQTDQKHIFQLLQDVELIKKVIFEERHLVLAPLVTVECEKNKLLSEKNKGGENQIKSYVNQYHEHDTFVNKNVGLNHTNATKSNQLGQKSESSDRIIIKESTDILNQEKETSKFQHDTFRKLPDNVDNLESFRDGNVPLENKVNKLFDCLVAEQTKRKSLEKKFIKIKNRVDYLEKQLRSKNQNDYEKVDDLEDTNKQDLQSNSDEDQPYEISREYMSDVYQAIERGKLENTMYFKRIFVNSIKQLKYKPKYLKTPIEEKVDQQFMDFLPDSIQNCEKILDSPSKQKKLGQQSIPNKNLKDGFNVEFPYSKKTESKVQMEKMNSTRSTKQEVAAPKRSEEQNLDSSSSKLKVDTNELEVVFEKINDNKIESVKKDEINKSKISITLSNIN